METLTTDETGKTRPADFSLAKSFRCAWAGVTATARERNFRIQLGFGVLAVVLGFALRIEPYEWLAILLCIAAVLTLECLNTSIEAVVDLVCPDWNVLAKQAKDAAAAAPLIASVVSLVVGVIIFLPKLLNLIGVL